MIVALSSNNVPSIDGTPCKPMVGKFTDSCRYIYYSACNKYVVKIEPYDIQCLTECYFWDRVIATEDKGYFAEVISGGSLSKVFNFIVQRRYFPDSLKSPMPVNVIDIVDKYGFGIDIPEEPIRNWFWSNNVPLVFDFGISENFDPENVCPWKYSQDKGFVYV